VKPSLERVPCPVCSTEPARLLSTVPDPLALDEEPFGLVRCAGCGLVYTQPRPDAASLGAYYRDVYSGRGGDQMHDAQTNQGLWYINEARWKVLAPHTQLGPEDRVLDVGCGYGAWLAFVYGRTGSELFGIDTDAGSIERNLCKDHGTLGVGSLEEQEFPDGHFAMVSMMHSLEHMPRPVQTLVELRRVLRPGGLLFLEVPNYASLLRSVLGRHWFPLLVPQHLQHFEVPTLRRALEEAGFEHILVLRPAWCPAELTLSLGPLLGRSMGMPDPDHADPDSFAARLVTLVLVLVFLLVDLPLGVLLRLFGRSGSLVALAQAPSSPSQSSRIES
jgi:ubiquinone/menaquinone biosynthesis C-methylase UbiE